MFGINKMKEDIRKLISSNSNLSEELAFLKGKDIEIVVDNGFIKITLIRHITYRDLKGNCLNNREGIWFLQSEGDEMDSDKTFDTVKDAEEEKKKIIKERLGII